MLKYSTFSDFYLYKRKEKLLTQAHETLGSLAVDKLSDEGVKMPIRMQGRTWWEEHWRK